MARLETVAAKLEATQAHLAGNNSYAAVPAPVAAPQVDGLMAVACTVSDALAAAPLPAYQALLTGPLVATLDAAEAVGNEVLRATRLLAEGFQREAAGGCTCVVDGVVGMAVLSLLLKICLLRCPLYMQC